jgi:AcrR family transcriptional regulator
MPPIKKIIRDAIEVRHALHEHRRATRDELKNALKAMVNSGKRARAVASEDKEARRTAILDAAEQLFSTNHALANVADVAVAAGLAKGTVYLYFETKEEIYLAIHMRHVERFFTTLIDRMAEPRSFDYGEMESLAHEHMIGNRNYMPLCATCMGFGSHGISDETGAAFQQALGGWIVTAGAGLEKHFPNMDRGEGVRLLKHSYAVMIGLYHLLGERGEESKAVRQPSLPGIGSYEDEAFIALSRYWAHVTRTPSASASATGERAQSTDSKNVKRGRQSVIKTK